MSEVLRSVPTKEATESPIPTSRCFFIPGLTGNKQAIDGPKGIKAALEAEFGAGNVTTISSIVSKDKPTRDRYKTMADEIIRSARAGDTKIVLHSLGVSEFIYIKRAIRKKDRHFFKNATIKKNLSIIKIAETGSFKGLRERIRYVRENKRLGTNLAAEAMYAFPVKDVSARAMAKMFAPTENQQKGYRLMPFQRERDNAEYLKNDEKTKKEKKDTMIRKSVAASDYTEAVSVSEARAVELKKPLQAVFDANADRKERDAKIRWSRKGLVTLVRAVTNVPTRQLRKLHRSGIRVYSIQAELDRVTTLNRVARFYGSEREAKAYITVMEASPHSGIGLQPGEWARLIKTTGETKPALTLIKSPTIGDANQQAHEASPLKAAA